MFYQKRSSSAIARPWRQELCGGLTAAFVLAAVSLPALSTPPDEQAPARPASTHMVTRDNARSAQPLSRMASRTAIFSVARPDITSTSAPARTIVRVPAAGVAAAATEPAVLPSSFRMADGDAFPLVINIPATAAWRDVFRQFGGAIGVSSSSSPRPAYLNHTISPDGHLDEESVPTIGRFLFRLSDAAIRVVNDTIDPAAHIAPGQSAFGVFAAPFRSVVARVLQEFCATEHLNPDDLTGVQLELGPGFGLRVMSTTRRAKTPSRP
jgi:hypothetical protein